MRFRSRLARAVRPVLFEKCESRSLFSAAYFDLSTNNLTQDWSNTALLGTNDNWDNIPSIEGYRGDSLVSAVDVDPQTVVAPGIASTDTPAGVLDVNVNQTAPNTFSTGGVAEFELTDPTIAIKGSGSPNKAPFILLRLNTLGRSSVQVNYVLRDLTTNANDAVMPVALQYRVGETGDFINIPSAFQSDVTDANGSKAPTSVSATLPVDAENAAQVQVRIITTDRTGGTDEWVGVDNINVTSQGTASPGLVSFAATNFNVNENAGTATVTVNRIGGSVGAASVNYATIAGGSATLVDDYQGTSGTLNWADGDSAPKTFTVTIVDDGNNEAPETINLQLTGAAGATIGANATATLTIVDNDAPSSILFNEISADVPGVDEPWEFAEIKGSGSLSNVYLVDLQGDAGSTIGQVQTVINLGAGAFGSNGLLIVKAPTTGHTVQDANTGILTNAKFAASGGAFGSNSESFLLVYSPTSVITAGQALGDASGNLTLPSGAILLDALGWSDGGTSDKVFGGVDLSIAPASSTTIPGVATRIVGNNTAVSAGAWYAGRVTATDSLTYAAAPVTANVPAGAVLTPGAANFTGASDTTPPTYSSAVFNYNTSATKPSITVTFSEAIQNATLDDTASSSFTIFNRATNTAIPASNFSVSTTGSTAKITFNGGVNAPADGDFKVVVNAGNIKDTAGNALAASSTQNYSFLQADANVDRKVNTLDFNFLAGNFGPTGKTFSQGDFNFDGNIDSTDFSILAGQYGKTLPSTPPPAPLARASSPFGGQPVSGDSKDSDLFA